MPYLKEHIRRPYISANAGNKVWIVSDYGNTIIVTDINGKRFSVNAKQLSEEKPTVIPPLPDSDKHKKRTKR